MRYHPRGKRSGRSKSFEGRDRKDIHSKIDGMPSGTHSNHHHNTKGTSVTAVIAETAHFFKVSDVGHHEAALVAEGLTPLRSLSSKQLLGVFRPEIETETIKGRQLDKRTGNMVEVTDQRLVWKSDDTLLVKGNPFRDAESSRRDAYKRQGSVSVGLNKRAYTESIPNANPTPEKVIGPAIDGVWQLDPLPPLTQEDIAKAFDKPKQ